MINFQKLLSEFTTWGIKFGVKIIAALVILIAGYYALKFGCKALQKLFTVSKHIDEAPAGFIISIVKVVGWFVIILAAVGRIINITSLIAALGAAGLTASFALQGSLSNFISGMQVIFSKPFSVGDYLSVDGTEGVITKIDVLNTTLHTLDNKEVIIPNSKITSGIVTNFSSQATRRVDVSYEVAYTADHNKALAILKRLAESDSRVLSDPAPFFAIGSYNSSSVQLIARLWVNGADYWDVYFAMQKNVVAAFHEEGIEIPFPQMVVHTK